MKKQNIYALFFSGLYVAFSAYLVVSYLVEPRDQLIFQFIISLPFSLLLLPLADASWHGMLQAGVIGLLGLVQFYLLGYWIGHFIHGNQKQ